MGFSFLTGYNCVTPASSPPDSCAVHGRRNGSAAFAPAAEIHRQQRETIREATVQNQAFDPSGAQAGLAAARGLLRGQCGWQGTSCPWLSPAPRACAGTSRLPTSLLLGTKLSFS